MKHGRMYVIYCYTNKITWKKYVGQTYQSLEKRASYNGCKYKGCPVFWKAIQKYGWENFVGEILEDGLTLEQANEREQYWISQLNTLTPNGYNCAIGGMNVSSSDYVRQRLSQALKGKEKHYTEEGRQRQIEASRQRNTGSGNPFYGKKHSEETKRKMSAADKGRVISEETKQKMRVSHLHVSKAVQRFSKDGQFIDEYPSILEASRVLGIAAPNISQCASGYPKHKTAGGYIWKYKEVA